MLDLLKFMGCCAFGPAVLCGLVCVAELDLESEGDRLREGVCVERVVQELRNTLPPTFAE